MRLSLPGFFAAIVALAVQLAAASLVPRPALAALQQGVICHADAGQPPAHHRQPMPDCPFCPFCLALAHPAPTLAAAPPMPAPSVGLLAHPVMTPPARAPPALPFPAARPRGPPIPV